MNRAWIHTFNMRARYDARIRRCVDRSMVYRQAPEVHPAGDPRVSVEMTDSVSAALDQDGRVCILNFASYTTPGGRFLDGKVAQEESLCHESFLYNVLNQFQDYYAWNRQHLNDGYFTDAAIYTPEVLFRRPHEDKECDVLTCASPIYGDPADRIRFIAAIANAQKPDVLILGAFGCGVFGQDPRHVAKCFKSAFLRSDVPKIVYALTSEENYRIFRDIMR